MVERRAVIANELGIHCRPSSVIMKAMKGYEGSILVTGERGEADLTSIYSLLTMMLQQGEEVLIRVEGPNEKEVCDQLVNLFEKRFDFPPLNQPAGETHP